MDARLITPLRVLRLALGLTATLAGLDKFFNILANWGSYVSPLAAGMLPFSVSTLMAVVGVVEIAVGIAILFAAPRLGAYVASVWLSVVAVNLATAGFFDIAVRDVVMAIAALRSLVRWACRRSHKPDPGRRRPRVVTASLLVAGILPIAPARAQMAQHPTESNAAMTLRQDMRQLWTDHVVWTRAYVVAAVGDQPDAAAAASRLMKNQEDIGAAVASFYGKAAGDQLTSLLKEHITIAVDIIKFAKAGDKAAQQQADARWRQNGDAIATFLSKAIRNWPRAVLVQMMNTHLSTTTDEVVARLTKNWEADVRAFDAAYAHILAMSDALADGIIKQFPAIQELAFALRWFNVSPPDSAEHEQVIASWARPIGSAGFRNGSRNLRHGRCRRGRAAPGDQRGAWPGSQTNAVTRNFRRAAGI
jgi:uncharacterized membrane protein YphA (DoxX/SURF4 family)